MATWPASLKHLRRTQFAPIQGMRWRRMASGKPNARLIYDTDLYQVQLMCHGSAADVDTLLAFYKANRDKVWTYNYDGDNEISEMPTTYETFFLGEPSWELISNSDEYMMVSSLISWGA